MTEPKDIQKQTRINSKDLTPEEANETLDELKDDALEDLSGGIAVTPYSDHWSGSVAPITKDPFKP